MEVVDVAVLDIVVISSEMERAAVGNCKPGYLASLITDVSQIKVFKSSKVFILSLKIFVVVIFNDVIKAM